MVVFPSQPMSILVGCTCKRDLPLHGTTLDGGASEAAGEVALEIADGDDIEAVAASVTTLLVDAEYEPELMVHPTPKPMARAATTPAASPTRTAVLRRNMITADFWLATEGRGAVRFTRDPALPRCERDVRPTRNCRDSCTCGFNFHPTQYPVVTRRPVECRRSSLLLSGGGSSWSCHQPESSWSAPSSMRFSRE